MADSVGGDVSLNEWLGPVDEPEAIALEHDLKLGGIATTLEGPTEAFGTPELDTDLYAPAGECLTIICRCGCGKSSLMRTAAGIGWTRSSALMAAHEKASAASGALALADEGDEPAVQMIDRIGNAPLRR